MHENTTVSGVWWKSLTLVPQLGHLSGKPAAASGHVAAQRASSAARSKDARPKDMANVAVVALLLGRSCCFASVIKTMNGHSFRDAANVCLKNVIDVFA